MLGSSGWVPFGCQRGNSQLESFAEPSLKVPILEVMAAKGGLVVSWSCATQVQPSDCPLPFSVPATTAGSSGSGEMASICVTPRSLRIQTSCPRRMSFLSSRVTILEDLRVSS